MLWYLPGCDLNANHPEAGRKVREYLLSKGDIERAECCRKDLSMLEAGDTIIQNCTLCELMLAERVPQIRVTSLYEYLLGDESFPWPDFGGRTMTLQDCYRMRNNVGLQDAVRECLTRMNINYLELEERRESSRFCGVWLNNPPAPDCVELAPRTFAELENVREILTPAEQKERMHAVAAGYPTDEVAVYCNGCERGVRLGGKEPFHLVELIAAGL